MGSLHPQVDFGFCDERFPNGTHMCLIFSSEQEREHVIAQYVSSGLAQGEKVSYFADASSPQEIRSWLEQHGVTNLPEPGDPCFAIATTEATYCPHGYFDPQEMLGNLKTFYEQSQAEQFPGSRVSGEMVWALKGIPGSERLMEYEARVNMLVNDYPVNAICQYDARRFDGAAILECLKVHPFMIVRGQIVENPYYLSPDEYLRQRAGPG